MKCGRRLPSRRSPISSIRASPRRSRCYAPESCETRSSTSCMALEGAVGSDLERAVWQELGTSRIPPRSFLVSSAISSEDKIRRMAAATTVAALSGFGHFPVMSGSCCISYIKQDMHLKSLAKICSTMTKPRRSDDDALERPRAARSSSTAYSRR